MSNQSILRALTTDLVDPMKQAVAGDRLHRIVLLLLTACVLAVPLTLPPAKLFNVYPGMGDDLFYYLKPALNFWCFGFPTFDGISLTNGFHPLWMALNVLLALPFAFLGGAAAFPYASLFLNLLLVLFFGQAVFSLARRVGLSPDGSAVVSLVSVCATAEYHINGMESATVLVTLALLFLYLVDRADKPEAVSPLSLALLSLLVLLSRLDNGMFLLLLYALLLPRLGFRKVFTAGILLTLLALPYLLTNHVTQGSFVPISKQSKDFWNSLIELDRTGAANLSIPALIRSPNLPYRVMHLWEASVRPVRVFIGLASLGAVKLTLAAALLVKMTVAAAAVVCLGWAALARHVLEGSRPRSRFLIRCLAVLAVFVIFQLCWYALTCWRFWPWYLTLDGWLLAAVLTAFVVMLVTALPCFLSRCILRVYLLVFFLFAFGTACLARAETCRKSSIGEIYMELAGWLRENTAPDAVCGSWAAGQIGYFSDRRLINLEGLIGDRYVLEANRRLRLAEYLAEKKVAWIAQHFPPASLQHGTFLPLSVLWHLRLKPLADFSDAFDVVRVFEGRRTNGYILRVDQQRLQELLREKREVEAHKNILARTLPAEDFADAVRARVRLGVVGSFAFAVVADRLEYSVNGVPPGRWTVMARVLAAEPDAGFTCSANGTKSRVNVKTTEAWALVRCSDKPMSVADNGTATFMIEPLTPGLHFDEFYFVPPEDEERLRSVLQPLEGSL